MILTDDLGYGDLGCYGQERVQTPNLDRLAEEGVRFSQSYGGSPVCAPSRWCLMTGLHTGHARTLTNEALLYPEDHTVAELLKSAGYTTAGIGKWGLGGPDAAKLPNDAGFDQWFGYLDQTAAHEYYPEYLWRNREMCRIEANAEGRKGAYSHDLFTEEALSFIRSNQHTPFFLYLAYTIPHANNELYDTTKNGMEVPSDEPYSGEPWPQVEKRFAAMVTRMDRDVGRLVQLLQELGLDQDTVIFFTSDNGPHREGGHRARFFESAGGLRGVKRELYEGGIRVPLLVRWPGRIPPDTVSDHVCALWDFPATAAEIAGVDVPVSTDGLSVLPALLGQPQPVHEYLYWAFQVGYDVAEAARMGDWKGIRHNQGAMELYDLLADAGETQDVATMRPEIVDAIGRIMSIARA